jgi:TatD DNase family protein
LILSDSHCHLDRYQNGHLDEVLDLAKKADVGLILAMGMSVKGSGKTVRMAETHDTVYAAVGIHPFVSVAPTDEVRNGLRALTEHDRVVAIGEIGLDFLRKPETAEVQKELFRYELSLARELNLPVSVHCRNAYQDAMAILKKEAQSGLKGWIHSFFAGIDELQEWLDIGFYVAPGFVGIVRGDNAELFEAVRAIPEDRLLIETDSAHTQDAAGPHEIALVAGKIAELRRTTVEHIADITTANLKRLLNITG